MIVGEGPERKRILDEWNYDAYCNVTVLNRLPDLAWAWGRADVLACPSKTDARGLAEGLCLVAVEAIKHGIPVVGYKNGGLVDVVWPGWAGALVEGNHVALGRAIHHWAGHEADPPVEWRERFSVRRNMDMVFDKVVCAIEASHA